MGVSITATTRPAGSGSGPETDAREIHAGRHVRAPGVRASPTGATGPFAGIAPRWRSSRPLEVEHLDAGGLRGAAGRHERDGTAAWIRFRAHERHTAGGHVPDAHVDADAHDRVRSVHRLHEQTGVVEPHAAELHRRRLRRVRGVEAELVYPARPGERDHVAEQDVVDLEAVTRRSELMNVFPHDPLQLPVMRQPCCSVVGASGTNVSTAGSNSTTISKPLNWEPADVTSTNRSKSVPGVTVPFAGVIATVTAARAGAASSATARVAAFAIVRSLRAKFAMMSPICASAGERWCERSGGRARRAGRSTRPAPRRVAARPPQ